MRVRIGDGPLEWRGRTEQPREVEPYKTCRRRELLARDHVCPGVQAVSDGSDDYRDGRADELAVELGTRRSVEQMPRFEVLHQVSGSERVAHERGK